MRKTALRFPRFFAASLALSTALVSVSAQASLTQAESTQVREYYLGARANDASQVRAFVARPDLTPEESASALSAAVGSVAFTPQRAAFLHELVFASASLPSRSVLAMATTRAVLSRANEILAKFTGDFDAHADAVAEVTRLLVFLDQDIASAGTQRGVGAPPESGIAPAAYDDCVKAIGETIALHPRWLKPETKLSPVAAKVRAQAEILLLDTMNDSPTFRVDAADQLALTGARRTFFLELGVLLLDDSKASDARVDAARALFLRLPAARAGVLAVFFGDEKPGLVGGGSRKKEVVAVKSVLEPAAPAAPINLLPDDLPQGTLSPGAGTVDPALADLAQDLSVITVRRALANRGDLSLQATRDARAALAGRIQLGKPFPISAVPTDPNVLLAQAVELVAIDARASFDVAVARVQSSQKEPAALFSDAVGILAVYAPPAQAGTGLSLAMGHAKGDGTTETVIATNVRLAPTGAAIALVLSGAMLDVGRDPSGEVTVVAAKSGAVGKSSSLKRADRK